MKSSAPSRAIAGNVESLDVGALLATAPVVESAAPLLDALAADESAESGGDVAAAVRIERCRYVTLVTLTTTCCSVTTVDGGAAVVAAAADATELEPLEGAVDVGAAPDSAAAASTGPVAVAVVAVDVVAATDGCNHDGYWISACATDATLIGRLP